MAGYSGAPLAKKLGLKAGMRAAFLQLPADVGATLLPLEGVEVVAALGKEMPYVHYFAAQREDLERMMPRLKRALSKDGMLWISWRKGKNGTDLTDDTVRRVALAAGLVDVKVCAVDQTWSGLKLVYRVKDR